MRVWEKNFLITLTLFVVLFFGSLFAVTTTSFSSALNSERETTLREEYLLTLSLQQRLENDGGTAQSLTALAADYGPYYKRKGISLLLAKNGALLFSNLAADPGVSPADPNTRTCMVIPLNGEKYILVQDTLGVGDEQYWFLYLKNVTAIYMSFENQTGVLLAAGVFVSIIFAIALYFTLKKLYRPVNNLAHELRTPLTSIRGYAEYLKAAAISEEDRYTAIQYVIDESAHLSEVCEKLLIMADLREGEMRCEKVDVVALFENAKMTYGFVEYEVQTPFISGDKTLLQSLIGNLVSNAIKASEPGSLVHLHSYDHIIEVSDTGKGMSKKTLARILHPRRGIGDGNGLGIPLCLQIASLHGARLSFSSQPGEGTTVRVTFTAS